MFNGQKVPVVIFGGTAAYHLDLERWAQVVGRVEPVTPYGMAAPFLLVETPHGVVGFTSRHGEGELRRSARFVNHRANVWAARDLGARWILSWNGVGSLRPDWAVGDLVILSDLMDFTRGRVDTFEEGGARDRLWADVREPFDARARERLATVARTRGHVIHPRATYACTEGPRLETAAEIRLLQQAAADVVGMTLCPEVWLAHELGLRYASLAYITNHATGITPTARTGREFGVVVAETCFPILLETATYLMESEV